MIENSPQAESPEEHSRANFWRVVKYAGCVAAGLSLAIAAGIVIAVAPHTAPEAVRNTILVGSWLIAAAASVGVAQFAGHFEENATDSANTPLVEAD